MKKTSVQCLVALGAALQLWLACGAHASMDVAAVETASYRLLSLAECRALKAQGVITDHNPVPCHRLSKVSFSYASDNGEIKRDGELVVLDVVAPNVAAITDELLARQFFIASARPIEAYGGDDNASMAANNTSAFNGRRITGGSGWSSHAYGVAIDLNPVQNPFIDIRTDGTAQILPPASARYAVNRSDSRPNKTPRSGMAEHVADLFARHGFFVWGGDWNYPIDYQHFQVGPRSFVQTLAAHSVEDGRALLNRYIALYTACMAEGVNEDPFKRQRAGCIEQVFEAMP
ncbi:M15 family metallopeptidase [Marinobacter sp. SS21]|uniref:M15 family metallopeptidase n=1 Tax=Marinobacter sp. SS21 TaxID=2979460 RepID=UPI00232C9BD9|nr:M15 family metallopeptidase [Marinobacter sp. SS21]MDC0661025.1 M15 family metallopeptidase [Marinobacter sp. SS21]